MAAGGGVAAMVVVVAMVVTVVEGLGSWCIARSGSTTPALQTALDYACNAGADCSPIQASGLCYLPNTLQAHASYAFNSYYQRSNYAPGSCDFAGTATLTISDPSYGSCSYPATPNSAGGSLTPAPPTPSVVTPFPNTAGTVPMNNPTTLNGTTSPIFGGGSGGLSPGFGPTTTDTSGTGSLSLLVSSPIWFLPLLI